jgi:transcription elongation GreA/GreB family factor
MPISPRRGILVITLALAIVISSSVLPSTYNPNSFVAKALNKRDLLRSLPSSSSLLTRNDDGFFYKLDDGHRHKCYYEHVLASIVCTKDVGASNGNSSATSSGLSTYYLHNYSQITPSNIGGSKTGKNSEKDNSNNNSDNSQNFKTSNDHSQRLHMLQQKLEKLQLKIDKLKEQQSQALQLSPHNPSDRSTSYTSPSSSSLPPPAPTAPTNNSTLGNADNNAFNITKSNVTSILLSSSVLANYSAMNNRSVTNWIINGDDHNNDNTNNNADTSGLFSTPLSLPIGNTHMTNASQSVPTTSGSNTNVPISSASQSPPLSSQPTIQGALTLTRSTQSNNIVNTRAYYDIVFRTSTSGTIKTVTLDFPPGFYLGSAVLLEATGIGAGTIAASGSTSTGQTLTYTISNAINIPTNTIIRLSIGTINNSPNPGTTYQVTITTKDANGTTIDGPNATEAFPLKQIGTGDIADNTITSSKLADNAVTTAKLSQDAVHVVWDDGTPGNPNIFYRTNAGDMVDRSADILSNNAGSSTRPAIAIFGNNVYIVWSDNSPGNDEIFYRRSTDGGASFGSTVNLSNDAGDSTTPAIVVSGNNVYVAWTDLGNEEIFYRRSTDGGASFGSTVNLSNDADSSEDPAIVVSGNNVYVAWDGGMPGNIEIFYRRSTDGGASFGSTVNLSNNAGLSFEPSIAVSGNNVYVVWLDNAPGNNEIFYRRSTDGGASFGSTVNLSNDASNSVGQAIAVSGNNVYIVWSDSAPGNDEIFYRRSTDGGASFGSTVNLSNNAGDSTTPALAVSGNNVYVVWSDNAPGNPEVILRKSINAGDIFGSTINFSQSSGVSFTPSISVTPNNF